MIFATITQEVNMFAEITAQIVPKIHVLIQIHIILTVQLNQ